MNSTASSENSELTTSLHRLWRTRHGIELGVESEQTLRAEATKIKSLCVLHTDDGVLLGVIPMQWGEDSLANDALRLLMSNMKCHTMHISDQAQVYKYLRAWNRS